jgi:hypothetical protein
MQLRAILQRDIEFFVSLVFIVLVTLYITWPSHPKGFQPYGNWAVKDDDGSCQLRYEDWADNVFAYSINYEGVNYGINFKKRAFHFSKSWKQMFGENQPKSVTLISGMAESKVWLHYSEGSESLSLSASSDDEDGSKVRRGDLVKALSLGGYGSTMTLKYQNEVLATLSTEGMGEALTAFELCLWK